MSILDLAKEAGAFNPEDVNAALLFYGPPGSGKTHAATKDGAPLVLLMEPNGLSTIRRANPKAKVILVETLAQVREVMHLAKSGKLREAGYDRLVLDSLTEIQRLFKDEIIAAKDATDTEIFSQQDWGTLAEKMRRFMRTLRALPIPVVGTALADEILSETAAGAVVSFRPSFEGRKTPAEVAQFFNAVGFAVKRTEKDATDYRIMFDGPSRYVTKSCGDVSGVIEPRCVDWIQAIIGDPENSRSIPVAESDDE